MGKETNSIVSHHNYPFKWWILVTYVVQNSALLITLRSATLFSNPSSDSVISSTAVLFSEVLKLIFSLIMCFLFDARLSFSNLKNLLLSVINEDSSDLVKLSMPSILYVIQNNLQYIIETRVLYLIMYQFKIITTAMFYSNMLSRRIHFREWSAIIALMIGVSIVEACQNDVEGHYHASYPFGIASVLLAIVTSGFAGVYFEKILKSSKFSIWMINVQLSALSCMFGMVACLTQNTQEIDKHGFFAGYNSYTVAVIALQASVGLMVALSVKYSDSIHKSFAGSLSVVISGIVDAFLLQDIAIDQPFITGTLIVIAACIIFVVHTERQNSKQSTSLPTITHITSHIPTQPTIQQGTGSYSPLPNNRRENLSVSTTHLSNNNLNASTVIDGEDDLSSFPKNHTNSSIESEPLLVGSMNRTLRKNESIGNYVMSSSQNSGFIISNLHNQYLSSPNGKKQKHQNDV